MWSLETTEVTSTQSIYQKRPIFIFCKYHVQTHSMVYCHSRVLSHKSKGRVSIHILFAWGRNGFCMTYAWGQKWHVKWRKTLWPDQMRLYAINFFLLSKGRQAARTPVWMYKPVLVGGTSNNLPLPATHLPGSSLASSREGVNFISGSRTTQINFSAIATL